MPRICVLMASYNESARLHAVLADLKASAASLGVVHVFVVDDGSREAVSLAALPSDTATFRTVLAQHAVNLGQGAALETARRLALGDPRGFDAYVTMDADGQHSAADLPALVGAVETGADVALGDRFAAASSIPLGRGVLLFCARLFESVLVGRRMNDAHNGFRAFGQRAIEHVQLRRDGMAHATELALQVFRHRRLTVAFVPVTVRYTEASLAKGQRALSLFGILRDLLHGYLFDRPLPVGRKGP